MGSYMPTRRRFTKISSIRSSRWTHPIFVTGWLYLSTTNPRPNLRGCWENATLSLWKIKLWDNLPIPHHFLTSISAKRVHKSQLLLTAHCISTLRFTLGVEQPKITRKRWVPRNVPSIQCTIVCFLCFQGRRCRMASLLQWPYTFMLPGNDHIFDGVSLQMTLRTRSPWRTW